MFYRQPAEDFGQKTPFLPLPKLFIYLVVKHFGIYFTSENDKKHKISESFLFGLYFTPIQTLNNL